MLNLGYPHWREIRLHNAAKKENLLYLSYVINCLPMTYQEELHTIKNEDRMDNLTRFKDTVRSDK